MTKLIITGIVTAIGFAFWLWRRYWSKSAEIARLEKEIARILEEQQDALENNDMLNFDYLDKRRRWLCEKVRRICGR